MSGTFSLYTIGVSEESVPGASFFKRKLQEEAFEIEHFGFDKTVLRRAGLKLGFGVVVPSDLFVDRSKMVHPNMQKLDQLSTHSTFDNAMGAEA